MNSSARILLEPTFLNDREDKMAANATPRQGDVYLRFNGMDNYVEIPSTADHSVATTGELAVAAWIRPDILNFPRWERTGYVHWLGKGERVDDGDQPGMGLSHL
jgi:hypothetical protein